MYGKFSLLPFVFGSSVKNLAATALAKVGGKNPHFRSGRDQGHQTTGLASHIFRRYDVQV